MDNIIDRLKAYLSQNKKLGFALRDWLIRNGDNYTMKEALLCIYNAAGGKTSVMSDIIEHLTEKRKVYGRTQVYADNNTPIMGLRRNENGDVELYGYRPDMPLNPKGQHMPKNNKIFRKSDDQVSKTYQNSEEKIYDLGKQVRELFSDGSNHDITFIMQAIKKYAENRKIHTDKVVNMIKKGRLVYNEPLNRLVPHVKESKLGRTIIIDESVMMEIADDNNMTEYKFNSNIKHFLHDLLVNPSGAKIPFIFKANGINRSRMIYFLKKFNLLKKIERISDKDSDGNSKKATMMVKYQVPKKDFDRKLKKLFIRLFEDNSSVNDTITEDGEGSTTCDASSGQFSQPLFPLQRGKMYSVKEDTTCNTVGDYQYDVPFSGDDETLKRNNGAGGSNSINFAK